MICTNNLSCTTFFNMIIIGNVCRAPTQYIRIISGGPCDNVSSLILSYSQSSGFSRSLESVLGGPQDQDRGPGGNAAQRADPRRPMQNNLMQDPRRFSDAIIIPPARPPPPSFKCISPPNTGFKCIKPQMMIQDRRPGNPMGWPPQTHSPLHFQFQPQQQFLGNSNLARMAHLAKSSPQLDDGPEKEKERDKEKEREREKAKERYPPQVNKEAVIAQVWRFSQIQ